MDWEGMWEALRDKLMVAKGRAVHPALSAWTVLAWMEALEMADPDAEV